MTGSAWRHASRSALTRRAAAGADASAAPSRAEHWLTRPSIDGDERWFPTLLIGSRAGYANELLVDRSLPAPDRAEIAAALVETALELAGEASSAAWLYLSPEAAAEVAELVGGRTIPLLIGADTVLPVRWSALEEYVAWLKQSRRAKVRRDRRRFASYPGEVAVERLGDCIEQAAPLLAELQQRYGLVDTADDMRRYLARQAAELDDRSVVFAWRAEGRLLGFALFFELDGVLYARSVGFDAPYVGSGAYFSVAFYEPLRYAIERGLRELRFGGGTYEAKLLRGACPVPLWSLVVPPADELHRWRELLADWNEDALEWWQHSAGPIVGPLPRETWLQPVEQAAVASAGERTPLGGAAQP